MKRLPTEITVYDKVFTLVPNELRIKAYYNVQYFKYSDILKKHKYILHIILAEPFKLTKVRPMFKVQGYAINKYLEKNKVTLNNNAVFHTILDVQKYVRFVPDLSIYRTAFQYKKETEEKFKMKFGQLIAIFNPEIQGEIVMIPPIAQHFKANHDYGVVKNYDDALKLIDSLNHMSPDYVEGV